MNKMNQILCCDGYSRGQDGAILPTRDYPSYLARKISTKAIQKILSDHDFSVKMAGYWPGSKFFCVFVHREEVEVHKLAKKTWPIPGYLALRLGQ